MRWRVELEQKWSAQVECVQVRRNSPRVFAGSDWGCQSFAAEDDVCECGVAQNATQLLECPIGGGERRNRSGGTRSGVGRW